MEKYIETVKKILEERLFSDTSESQSHLIRLDHFTHPEVYYQTASHFQQVCQQKGIFFKAILSPYKHAYFANDTKYSQVLKKLEDNDFIDEDTQMTYWRNSIAGKPGIILLMGTESVPDQGGLADFYHITPKTIENRLGDNYHQWFNSLIDVDSTYEINAIDNWFKEIFKYVPKNLFKLSEIVDRLEAYEVNEFEKVMQALGELLWKDWRLPSFHYIDKRELTRLSNGKFKLLEKAVKFRDRADFRDGLKNHKFNKLQKQLKKYKEEALDESMLINDFGSFSSYEEFSEALEQFCKGENVDELRSKLCQMDFNIINKILNIKMPKEIISKEKTSKVYGQPFEAISKMILQSIQEYIEENSNDIETVTLDLKEVILADCLNDELVEVWNKVCFYCGGLLEFINVESVENLDGESITFRYKDDQDPFIVGQYDDKKVKAGSNLSSISFDIEINEEKYSYKWVFLPNSQWLHTFHYLEELNRAIEEKRESAFPLLPIFYDKDLNSLLYSTNEDEFFHILQELEFNCVDAVKHLNKTLSPKSSVVIRLIELGIAFQGFITSIRDYGLYNTININKNMFGVKLIQQYRETLDWYINNLQRLVDSEKNKLNVIANLFLFVHNQKAAEQSKELDGAIVTPYHPAMFEKIMEQQLFYRQGFASILRDLLEGNVDKKKIDKEWEYIVKRSTIISGVDTIISTKAENRIANRVYGYFALHGSIENETNLTRKAMLDGEILFDEDFIPTEMIKNTPISDLILSQIKEYVKTFPSQMDTLKLCFINFNELQPIVAGIHNFIKQNIKNGLVHLKVQIISSSRKQEGRSYLNFWLDHFFNEQDSVQIETFYHVMNLEKATNQSYLEHMIEPCDVLFIKDILQTKDVSYRKTEEIAISPSETRFPMVFHPMPISGHSETRKVSITQTQFEGALKHTQLVHWMERPDNTPGIYRVEKELLLPEYMKRLQDYCHEVSHWVVTLDSGLDKQLVENNRIISFSTGEGPYGELNMIISTSGEVKKDIANRLKNRLKTLFPSWDDEKLTKTAQNCLDKAKKLDGIKLMKALNPKDYEIHSFLGYILSSDFILKSKEDTNVILRAYLPLDSYLHWFERESRPDFLLLEMKRDGISEDRVKVQATLIECKMGSENEVHVSKGIEQLRAGLQCLQEKFNPYSQAYNKRYWFAQLYRALVFAPLFIDPKTKDELKFDKNLLKVLEGKFTIEWEAKLLTYWLEYNQEEIQQSKIELDLLDEVKCTHHSYGQLYIQKALLPEELLDSVQYENIDRKDLFFTNDEDDYNDKVKGYQWDEVVDERLVPKKLEKKVVEDTKNSEPYYSTTGTLILPKEETVSNVEVKEADDKSIGKDLEVNLKVADKPEGALPLTEVRVLLGRDLKTNQEVYWEYGHPELENRHILISGKSGVGKTYFMQCMLLELAKSGISSIIFDYTDGFKKSQLEPEFVKYLGDNLVQFFVYRDKFSVNPFKRQQKELDIGEYIDEQDTDVAERIKSVFSAVYKDKGIGSQQANAIYRATLNGLKKYGDQMSLEYLRSELQNDDSSYAKTILSQIDPLVDRAPFDSSSSYNWKDHRNQKGRVFVIQLSGMVREVQLLITEFILWDMWNFNLHHGKKNFPFPVILDEAQNLDHSEHSPSAKILTEGRKFGWSGWYATQFMKDQLKKDEIQRLQNASQKVYFAPPEVEIPDIASYLEPDSKRRLEWHSKLQSLKKGQCVVSGPMLKNGSLVRTQPRVIQVSPLSERI